MIAAEAVLVNDAEMRRSSPASVASYVTLNPACFAIVEIASAIVAPFNASVTDTPRPVALVDFAVNGTKVV
jgi:hypothetical protein